MLCGHLPPPPRKNGPNTLRIASHVMTLKTPSNLYAPPSSIDMEIMIRQHRESHPPPLPSPLATFPRKIYSPGYSPPLSKL